MMIKFDVAKAEEGKQFVHTEKGAVRNTEREQNKPAWCVQFNQTDGGKVPLSWVKKGLVNEVNRVSL